MTSSVQETLAGYRVLDFTAVMAGPFATRMLADHGADVIKVEPPGGDQMRTRPPLRAGHSSYFGALNCGKRSIVLDLKHPDGQAIASRLARSADVVVENFRPGVMAKLGLGYSALAADNPGLIYCSISGFGQFGPSAAKPAYAPVIHAASGYDLANLGYQTGTTRPARTGIFTADVLGGTYAFGAIQTALLHRERTGAGQHVDVSMLDAMVALQVYELQSAQFPSDWHRPVYSPLCAADGYVVVAPTSPGIFARLCEAIDRADLRDDPRFTSIALRDKHWVELLEQIEKWTRERPGSECEEVLLRAGVPCSRYRDIEEILNDQHIRDRGSLAEVRDQAGSFLVANPPYALSATPARARSFVAEPGAHAEQILQELLGCTDDEISAWRSRGALGDQPEEKQ
ncbi:CaiB/BaiF CoA transferase family protein [Kibdelosporangium aridum]|uniref:CaiB/BaiF CoA transferase family protein n=1 Tax=Kibdelosporangium aridum TaxID=2030 RepID=UPI00052756E4